MTQWVWAHSTSRGRRRGRGQVEKTKTREQFLAQFREEVMDPYIFGLQDSLDQKFQHLENLGAFSVLGPQAALSSERINTFNLTLLSRQFLQVPEAAVLQEWLSYKPYKQHVLVGAFKGLDQLTAMTKLASQFDEWGQSTPALASWQQSH